MEKELGRKALVERKQRIAKKFKQWADGNVEEFYIAPGVFIRSTVTLSLELYSDIVIRQITKRRQPLRRASDSRG